MAVLTEDIYGGNEMFQSYLKPACRAFFLQKRFSAITIVGLALLLTSVSVQAAYKNTSDKIDTLLRNVYAPSDPGVAVLVYKGGEILLRKGYGLANVELNVPVKVEHRFRLASVTKQFTAIAVLKLVEQGTLDLDADVRTYLPDFPDKGYKITLRHALGHTSGLANYTDNDAHEATIHMSYTLDEILKYFQDDPLSFKPGTDWTYSNSGYVLAAKIMEVTTGKDFPALMDDLLLAPAGMSSSAFYDPEKIIPGTVTGYDKHGDHFALAPKLGTWGKADGGLYSTVDDMLKWYLALRSNSLVSERSKSLAFTSQKVENGDATGYGFGQFIGRVGSYRTVEHGGNVFGWNAYTIMVPSEDLFVVLLSNQQSGVIETVAAQAAATALDIASIQPAPYALSADAMKAFTGRYAHGPNDVREISFVDGILYSRRGSGDLYKLTAMDERHFFFDTEPEIQILFGSEQQLRVQYRFGKDHLAKRIID